MRLVCCLGLVWATLAGILPAQPAQAQPYSTVQGLWLFAESGYAMRDPLAAFWQAHGGLEVFGVAIDAAQYQPAQPIIQWFERARLEEHPANPSAYRVQLGLVGKEALVQQQRDWRTEDQGEPMEGPCQTFAQTARTVCGPFLRYWRAHGLDFGTPGITYAESLALFGLPLTAPRYETNSSGDTVLTQWFERARFEWHPNNPPAYQVLPGRLGAELHGEAATPQPLAFKVPDAVLQGHTWMIILNQPDFVHVDGMVGSWPMTWGRMADGRWRGLGGISVLTKPGPVPVIIAAQHTDGSTFFGSRSLTVADANYPAERISLPPEVNERIADNQAAVQAENAAVAAIWPLLSPHQWWDGTFQLPADGVISSNFGTRRAYNDGPYTSYHEGVDIANSINTPVYAAARGRVVFAQDDLIVRGGAVIIDHGQGVHTGYWHLNKVEVSAGQLVEQGEQIGRMGSKGFSTAPHLHWDVRIGSLPVDPLEWTETQWNK